MKLTFATVCSGIDAPTVAWKSLGWKQVFASEIEPFPCEVLKHHHPEIPNYGNLLDYEKWPRTSLDVLIGGTPCQSFSVAGLRKGLADPRGNLALTFLGVVERFAPTWVIWENVPGVLSSDQGRAFGSFLGGLGQLGYGFAYAVLDAQFFGVPQRRRRVFVVGHSGGQWQRAAAVLFDRESLCGNPPPRRSEREGITHSLAPCLGASGRGFERTRDTRGQDAVIPIQETGQRQSGNSMNGVGHGKPGDPMLTLQNGSRHGDAVPNVSKPLGANALSKGRETDLDCTTYIPEVLAHGQGNSERVRDGSPSLTCNHEAPIAFIPEVGFARSANPSHSGDKGDGGVNTSLVAFPERMSGTQRAAAENISPSLGSVNPTAFALRMAVRRLTPKECERLQGFPDQYTLIERKPANPKKGKVTRIKMSKDGPRYKALGNSMAVPVIKWLGERIELVHNLK